MQWRMLARRCPTGSCTLVGDFGQASPARRGVAAGTTSCRTCPSHDAPRRVDLTVNYRTPAEIMELANRLLAVAAPEVPPTRSVRTHGRRARVRPGRRPRRPRPRGAARAFSARRGTTAVIAPVGAARGDHRRARATSARWPTRPRRSTRRSACSTRWTRRASSSTTWSWWSRPSSSPPDRAGLRLLYVTLTRRHPGPRGGALRAAARGAARLTAQRGERRHRLRACSQRVEEGRAGRARDTSSARRDELRGRRRSPYRCSVVQRCSSSKNAGSPIVRRSACTASAPRS